MKQITEKDFCWRNVDWDYLCCDEKADFVKLLGFGFLNSVNKNFVIEQYNKLRDENLNSNHKD